MLDANIHESLNALNASHLAMLLVMRKGLDFGYEYTFTDDDGQSATVDHAFLAAAPGDLLEVIFEETSMTTPSTRFATKPKPSAAFANGVTTAGAEIMRST